MTTRVMIPLKDIREAGKNGLDLFPPTRCSRCDDKAAPFFETHEVRYQAGMLKQHSFPRKFRTSIPIRLRLPLCDKCYRQNFMEAPETTGRDKNPLGVFARWRTFGIQVGSIFALIAFLILMDIFKLPSPLAEIRRIWLYPIGASLLVFAATFGSTALKNRNLKNSLALMGYNFKLHRALSFGAIRSEETPDDTAAVSVVLENDTWAGECATNRGWKTQVDGNQPEKD